jgi:enoyl-CoA hydratase/carnithine racemase
VLNGSVLYESRGRVALITLNRPERMNAVDQSLWDGFDAALTRYADDDEAWAAVITGAGHSFSVGADLADINRTGTGKELMEPPARMYKPALGGIWKPIIAAINGNALAVGWWIAQVCDIRIAAESAQLGIPETRWNLRSDFVTDLTRIVGLGHALEIGIWGDRRLTAQRAYEIGFVNKVVPDARLLDEALDWADRATRLGPRAIAVMKESIYTCWGAPTDVGTSFARAAGSVLTEMEDTAEGPRAFLERRAPKFTNR